MLKLFEILFSFESTEHHLHLLRICHPFTNVLFQIKFRKIYFNLVLILVNAMSNLLHLTYISLNDFHMKHFTTVLSYFQIFRSNGIIWWNRLWVIFTICYRFVNDKRFLICFGDWIDVILVGIFYGHLLTILVNENFSFDKNVSSRRCFKIFFLFLMKIRQIKANTHTVGFLFLSWVLFLIKKRIIILRERCIDLFECCSTHLIINFLHHLI